MTNITCFKCGKKGHIGANCKVKSSKSSDGKSSKISGKSSAEASQDGKPSSKGSGKGKKEKMFEVTEGDGEQDGDETAGVQIRLPWFSLDLARWSVRLRSWKLLRWILHLSIFRTLFVMISLSNQNLKQ